MLIALAVFALTALLVYGVSFVSYLPRYSIGPIVVEGEQEVPEDLIRHYAETVLNDGSYHILSRKNIFLYPRAAIEKGLVEQIPRIKSAHASRSSLLSTTLDIKVEEREPYALWCRETMECFLMDESGLIFAETASSTPQGRATQYVFEGGMASAGPIGQKFIPANFAGLLSLLKLLGQSGFEPVGAGIENQQDVSIPLRKGFLLKISFGKDGNTLVKNLQLILSSDALRGKENSVEYVDLRFGDRVYYKLKGESEQQEPR